MSNDSVTRVANNGSPPSTSDVRKPLPNRVEVISEMISEMKKIGASGTATRDGARCKSS
jgi:hypothetical protein